jgi:hypothetical protein
MNESKNRFYITYYIIFVSLLAALLMGGCGSESPTEVPTKRESHFEVTDVIAAPGRDTEDIVFTAGSLWVSDSDGAGTIYRISANDGTVQAQNQPAFGRPGSLLAADGALYVADKYGGGIHKIAANDRMDVLNDYETGLSEIRGLFYTNSTFYAYDYAEGAVFELDGDFNIVGTYSIDTGPRHLRGFRMIGGTLWSADAKRGWVNIHDGSYAVTAEYVTVCNYPRGIAWDGQYMYLGDPEGRKIYQMDISQ